MVIFSENLANYLLEKGYVIKQIAINHNNIKRKVYIFKDKTGLISDIEIFKSKVSKILKTYIVKN